MFTRLRPVAAPASYAEGDHLPRAWSSLFVPALYCSGGRPAGSPRRSCARIGIRIGDDIRDRRRPPNRRHAAGVDRRRRRGWTRTASEWRDLALPTTPTTSTADTRDEDDRSSTPPDANATPRPTAGAGPGPLRPAWPMPPVARRHEHVLRRRRQSHRRRRDGGVLPWIRRLARTRPDCRTDVAAPGPLNRLSATAPPALAPQPQLVDPQLQLHRTLPRRIAGQGGAGVSDLSRGRWGATTGASGGRVRTKAGVYAKSGAWARGSTTPPTSSAPPSAGRPTRRHSATAPVGDNNWNDENPWSTFDWRHFRHQARLRAHLNARSRPGSHGTPSRPCTTCSGRRRPTRSSSPRRPGVITSTKVSAGATATIHLEVTGGQFAWLRTTLQRAQAQQVPTGSASSRAHNPGAVAGARGCHRPAPVSAEGRVRTRLVADDGADTASTPTSTARHDTTMRRA